jgi:hypothetical protein
MAQDKFQRILQSPVGNTGVYHTSNAERRNYGAACRWPRRHHNASEIAQFRHCLAIRSCEDSADHRICPNCRRVLRMIFRDVSRAAKARNQHPHAASPVPSGYVSSKSETPVACSRCFNCSARLDGHFFANCVNLLRAAVDTMPDAMFVFVPLIALSHMAMYSGRGTCTPSIYCSFFTFTPSFFRY